MNYFTLTNSIDLKEVGDDSQVQKIGGNYNVNAPYSFRNIDSRKPIDFDFIPPTFILSDRAKFTDLMHSVPTNYFRLLLISGKFFEVLKSLNLPLYNVYKCIVRGKDNIEKPYFLLYLNNTFDGEYIDYEKSEFAISKHGHFIEKIDIISRADYLAKKETIKSPISLSFLSLVLTKDIPFDIFRLLSPYYGFLISHKLKEAIEKHKITGVRIEDLHSVRPLVPREGGGYKKIEDW